MLTERGATPTVQDFDEPSPVDGAVLIDVTTAGFGCVGHPRCVPRAVQFPCVIRAEGVGRAEEGRRVYFGERSLAPFGAWAERTVVPAAEVWDVPDDIDDELAIAMAIAGTGAVVPLEQADIQKGESVLVLGATGTLGQIALQLARRSVPVACRGRPRRKALAGLSRMRHRRRGGAHGYARMTRRR